MSYLTDLISVIFRDNKCEMTNVKFVPDLPCPVLWHGGPEWKNVILLIICQCLHINTPSTHTHHSLCIIQQCGEIIIWDSLLIFTLKWPRLSDSLCVSHFWIVSFICDRYLIWCTYFVSVLLPSIQLHPLQDYGGLGLYPSSHRARGIQTQHFHAVRQQCYPLHHHAALISPLFVSLNTFIYLTLTCVCAKSTHSPFKGVKTSEFGFWHQFDAHSRETRSNLAHRTCLHFIVIIF